MKVRTLDVAEVLLLTPARHGDARGWLSETFSAARLAAIGLTGPWVQDNHSFSAKRGTIRGLHCQIAPSEQGKLVRVVRGAIWDVAVDIRHGSATFGHHAAATLSASNGDQLWVPPGFLHGFVTLEPECEILYKVTAAYDRQAERGVAWNDPGLALPWPVERDEVTLSERDAVMPLLADCAPWFRM